MASKDRLPPQNLDAERSVLGSALRDNASIDAVSLLLSAESFYTDAHRKIFDAIATIYQGRKPVDVITLAEEIKARGQIEDIGGYGYFSELLDAAPTAINAVHYARIIREKAMLRSLIGMGTEIARDASDEVQSADELLEAAERRVFQLGEATANGEAFSMSQTLDQAADAIDERSNGRRGVLTGLDDIDLLTSGFQPGELTVVAARPSVGKTSILVAVMRHYLMAGGAALLVSLEQPASEIGERQIASEGRINTHHLRDPSQLTTLDRERLGEAMRTLRSRKLWVLDTPSLTPSRIAAHARSHRRRNGIGLLTIDYLQLVEPEDRRANREEQVGNTARRLKMLARELKIPVVVAAQLNRESEHAADGRPRLSQLRESGGIENHADCVWLLWNPREESGAIRRVNVDVAKCRNGQTGELALRHHRAEMRFEALSFTSAF